MASNHSELGANERLPVLASQDGTDQQPPPSAAASPNNVAEQEQERTKKVEENQGNAHAEYDNKISKGAREIVRLFQCRICSQPFTDAVTLPCGKSVCQQCLPGTYQRQSISYPAVADRQERFRCPFEECGKEHVLTDSRVDVILNKVADLARSEMERKKEDARELQVSTQIVVLDPWGVAGVASLRDEDTPRIVNGSRTVATWALAESGELNVDTELSYSDASAIKSIEKNDGVPALSSSASSSPSPPSLSNSEILELDVLQKMQSSARHEMDCQVCYALFIEPLTTGCGHTFCRSCLHRILDHSRYCPVCRRHLNISPLLDRESCPSNSTITNIIETFWVHELAARRAAALLEHDANQQQLGVPLFICTLAFPGMPTFLHVFEPRYRLMIRRALEGNKTFGMVLPKPRLHSDDTGFYELGTLLRITDVQFYPDGRSLIETRGLSRFKVLRHGSLDGYTVCSTERVDDMSLEDEEAIEAAEVMPTVTTTDITSTSTGTGTSNSSSSAGPSNGDDSAGHQGTATTTIASDDAVKASHKPSASSVTPLSVVTDMHHMSTQDLMNFATSFVDSMEAASVPWLTQRIIHTYGRRPGDAATFPWWFASILPVKDGEKYKLLSTASVRQRLKICCSWIAEWETSRWSLHGCNIL